MSSKRVYVYYNYDYHEMGGVGMVDFDSIQDAEEFITGVAGAYKIPEEKLSDKFTIISGKELSMKPREKITVIELEER